MEIDQYGVMPKLIQNFKIIKRNKDIVKDFSLFFKNKV